MSNFNFHCLRRTARGVSSTEAHVTSASLAEGFTSAYPDDVFLVENPAQVQESLDAYGKIRLLGMDYSQNGAVGDVVVSSNQHIYGLRDSKLPGLVIKAGTTGAVISSVKNAIEFESDQAASTNNNFFHRVSGVTVLNSIVEENLFVQVDGKVSVDTVSMGRFKNNRFIRLKVHAVWPQLVLKGNPERDSTGNIFLFANFLTAHGYVSDIQNQGELSLIGWDAESWNANAEYTDYALFRTTQMSHLKIFGGGGGSSRPVEERTPFIDSDADNISVYESNVSGFSETDMLIGESTKSVMVFGSNPYSYLPALSSYKHFEIAAPFSDMDSGIPKVNGTPSSSLNAQEVDILQSNLKGENAGAPWPKPLRRAVPDPAGVTWEAERASTGLDHTAAIQAMLDADGFAYLDEGTYYISSPLLLRADDVGIIGKGMDKTVIVAKTSAFNIMETDEGVERLKLTLLDVTIQGGLNGVYVYADSLDGEAQILTDWYMGHVTFRNMANAGVMIEYPEGAGGNFDNHLISYVNFVDSDYGFYYDSPVPHPGNYFPVALMDKVVFYKVQFIGNSTAIYSNALRANHKNTWVDCYFDNNEQAVDLNNFHTNPLIANSVFENNDGDPMIKYQNKVVFLVGNHFKTNRAQTLISSGFRLEGNTIDAGAASSLIKVVEGQGIKGSFYNNTSALSANNVGIGVFSNNIFPVGDTDLSSALVVIKDNVKNVIVSDQSDGKPRLLTTK